MSSMTRPARAAWAIVLLLVAAPLCADADTVSIVGSGAAGETATLFVTFNAQTNTTTVTLLNTSTTANITGVGADLPPLGNASPTGLDGFTGDVIQPAGVDFDFTDAEAGSVPNSTAVLDFAFLTGATFAAGVFSEGLPPGIDPATFTVAGDGFSGFTEEQIANAFLVRFQQQAVPEPSTLLLMGLGLGAAGWAARRRRG
jgi:hypothetical protein